jgi:hypothetical protein
MDYKLVFQFVITSFHFRAHLFFLTHQYVPTIWKEVKRRYEIRIRLKTFISSQQWLFETLASF